MTGEELRGLADLLHGRGCSCVVRRRDGVVREFQRRGVADLYDLLKEHPRFLLGADVADKVVGKGAAALMAAGRVARVYADVASEPARELLLRAGIPVCCGLSVPAIRNRAGDGLCPLESLCLDKETAEECLPVIEGFVERQRARSGADIRITKD